MDTDKLYKLMLAVAVIMLCLVVSFAVYDAPSFFDKDVPNKPVIALAATESSSRASSSPVSEKPLSETESELPSSAAGKAKAKNQSGKTGSSKPSGSSSASEPPESEPEPPPLWEDINVVTKEQLMTVKGLSEKAIDGFLEFRENFGFIDNELYLAFAHDMTNADRLLLLEHVYIPTGEQAE